MKLKTTNFIHIVLGGINVTVNKTKIMVFFKSAISKIKIITKKLLKMFEEFNPWVS